jgi:hypothetical protein
VKKAAKPGPRDVLGAIKPGPVAEPASPSAVTLGYAREASFENRLQRIESWIDELQNRTEMLKTTCEELNNSLRASVEGFVPLAIKAAQRFLLPVPVCQRCKHSILSHTIADSEVCYRADAATGEFCRCEGFLWPELRKDEVLKATVPSAAEVARAAEGRKA